MTARWFGGALAAGVLVLAAAGAAADDRAVWKYDKGSYEKTGEGKWVERAPGVLHRLEEKSVTDKQVELYDPKRKVTVRITDTHVMERAGDKGPFKLVHKGAWEAAAAKTPDPKTPDPKTDTAPKAAGPFAETAQLKQATKLRAVGMGLSPDGKLVAMMVGDPKEHDLAVLDAATGMPVKTWKVPTTVEGFAWSADGTTLAFVQLSGTVKDNKLVVLDTKTWQERAVIDLERPLQSLAISANGGVVAGASGSIGVKGFARAWDVAARKELVASEITHATPTVALSADGKFLASNGAGPKFDQIAVLDLAAGKLVGAVPGSGPFVMTPDGLGIVDWPQVSEGKNVALHINLWDVRAPGKPRVIKAGRWMAERAAFLDENRHLALGGGIGQDEVRVYDLRTLALAHAFKVGPATKLRSPLDLRVTPDSSVLATYGTDHVVRLWSTPFGEKRVPPKTEPKTDK